MTAGCDAWFYCTDAGGCADWQSGEAVALGGCLLLAADRQAQPEPLLADVAAPGGFFSYQAGHVKGALSYVRIGYRAALAQSPARALYPSLAL